MKRYDTFVQGNNFNVFVEEVLRVFAALDDFFNLGFGKIKGDTTLLKERISLVRC